jgi:MFS family permease
VTRLVPRWVNRTVVGIVLATFFSDAGHEISTAALPLYLAAIGHGPEALAVIAGVSDFLVSLSKLAGGVLGHRLHHKRPLAALGYLITCTATSAMGLVTSVGGLTVLRSVAWIGRGYRGPLRDSILSDSVEKTHYGRVFGLERAGDMLGAVSGPLTAALLLWLGFSYRTVLLAAFFPGLFAAASMFFLTREKEEPVPPSPAPDTTNPDPPAQRLDFRRFYLFLVGVFAFGLGDFSRAFLILLAARALGEDAQQHVGTMSIAVLLYALHNAVSAIVAFPIGALGDKFSKRQVLIAGYGLGVGTNLLLAAASSSLAGVAVAIVMSGVYIAVEETLEKAAVADMLPKEGRSLGFGILAFTNAIGDLLSTLLVGYFLGQGNPALAFGLAAAAGAVGVLWLARFVTMTGRR